MLFANVTCEKQCFKHHVHFSCMISLRRTVIEVHFSDANFIEKIFHSKCISIRISHSPRTITSFSSVKCQINSRLSAVCCVLRVLIATWRISASLNEYEKNAVNYSSEFLLKASSSLILLGATQGIVTP